MNKVKNTKKYVIVSIIIGVVLWVIALLIDKYSLRDKNTYFLFFILHSMFNLNFLPTELCDVSQLILSFVVPLISYILMCIAYGENSKKAICRWALIPTNWAGVIGVFGIIVGLILILGIGTSRTGYWRY